MSNLKKRKKILIPIVLVLVLALGLGIWYFVSHRNTEPINAYPFHYLGMTEYWGDSQESYGPVTTDKVQTVYLSETQTVTEVLVSEGDTVKKGDLLMTFDTTLSDLALERERLEVEKLKLQLQEAETQLKRIKAMKPMVIPEYTEEENTPQNLGTALNGMYQISTRTEYDGSSEEKALICWVGSSTAIDDTLFEAIRQKAEEYQRQNFTSQEGFGGFWGQQSVSVSRYYVVFKVTEQDMSLGGNAVWQGMVVTKGSGNFTFKLFDASGVSDHMTVQMGDTPSVMPEIDFGSGYTAAQIAEMRVAQEKTIKDLQFKVKMAEANYKIKQTEVADGNVYAQIDGKVISLLTEDEALMNNQPFLKVSGGGGFYVQGYVSELTKDDLQSGQEVTVNDWNTGMVYTGTIQSVGDYPSPNGSWSGMGNPNSSYYPFTVYIDENADLQEGRYVSVMYSSAEAQNGIYLENFMIRTEQGKSYVYVLTDAGKLEKRYVVTGKSLWGSYTEILDGVTAEDYLAFPYGKQVKDGVPAVASEDISTLYGN